MPKIRTLLKYLLWLLGAFVVVVLGVVTWLIWPRSYPKTYLKSAPSHVVRGLAKSANAHRPQTFYVGTIGDPSRLEELDAVLPADFNSVTPENATKWQRLLRDGRLGVTGEVVYDFAAADRL